MVCSAPNQRNNDDDALERFMLEQKRNANALMLPRPEVPVFDGDPIEYQTFVRAFENLMEANTDSDSARLYYLIQYVRGYVRELMKSCLSMKNEEGYLEARRLLKQKYGQNYKIATAYIERVPPLLKGVQGQLPTQSLAVCPMIPKTRNLVTSADTATTLQSMATEICLPNFLGNLSSSAGSVTSAAGSCSVQSAQANVPGRKVQDRA